MPKLNLDDVDVTEDPKPGQDAADDDAQDPPEGDDDADQQQDDDDDTDDDADSEGDTTDEAADGAGDDADDLVVTIGDEPAAEEEGHRGAPDWVRNLRESNREKARLLREKDAEIARLKGSAAAPQPIGEKPTLAGCEFDEDKYEAALDAWKDRKRAVEEEAAKRKRAEDEAAAAWQKTLEGYNKGKAALKVRDFDDAEAVVQDLLDATQQGIIVAGATDPATLIYALGKNPKEATRIAAIKDPVKFAFAVAEVQGKMKVQPRKTAPPPERRLNSTAAGAAAVEKADDRLVTVAQKTGDVTGYLRHITAKRRAA